MSPRPLLLSLGVLVLFSLTGCLNLQFGGGTTSKPHTPTVGQQLIDLKRAKDEGVITNAEYETQRARLLETR